MSADSSEKIRSPSDRKSTRLNSSHSSISYAVLCLKKKNLAQADAKAEHGAHVVPGSRRQRRAAMGSRLQRCAARGSRRQCCAARVFFFNDTATTEIYTLSLHDALPI